jgi:hypothetical protein
MKIDMKATVSDLNPAGNEAVEVVQGTDESRTDYPDPGDRKNHRNADGHLINPLILDIWDWKETSQS